MVTRMLALAALIVTTACASAGPPEAFTLPPAPASEPSDPAIENAIASTLRLYNGSGRGICTAVAISETRIATAYHCVVAGMVSDAELEVLSLLYPRLDVELEGTLDAEIAFTTHESGEKRKARVKVWDIANDVAILEAGSPLLAHVRVNEAGLRVGQEVFHVGHPGGIEYTYTHGYVSHLCDRETDEKDNPIGNCYTRVDISIAGGSSGGGLFNRAGELVGITSAGYNRIALGLFATPSALGGLVRL